MDEPPIGPHRPIAPATVVGRDPIPIPTASPTFVANFNGVATNALDDELRCRWSVVDVRACECAL